MGEIFLAIALLCVGWGIISAIQIVSYLTHHGQKASILFFNILIFRYLTLYSKITTEQEGRPGLWHYSFIMSMNLALICALLGMFVLSN